MQYSTAYLVLLNCAPIHDYNRLSDAVQYHVIVKDGALAYMVGQVVAYLLYPLLGWLADVYFTRYTFLVIIVASLSYCFPNA